MTHSICVCNVHQTVVFLADAVDCDLTYKDLIKKIVCNTDSKKCMMHQCESCPGNVTLKGYFVQEHNKHEDDENVNYCQWDTTDQAMLATFTATDK